jgi:hypothetical protein
LLVVVVIVVIAKNNILTICYVQKARQPAKKREDIVKAKQLREPYEFSKEYYTVFQHK